MGATFDWTFNQTFTPRTDWYIDGIVAPTVTDERATDRSLTLQWRVSSAKLKAALRPLKDNQGKLGELDTDDGGYVAVDRADGANTFVIDPPHRRKPLRQQGEYLVADYEENLVSQSVDEWDVTVDFVSAANRTDSPSINQAASGAAFDWTFTQAFSRSLGGKGWAFDTRYGQLVTDRIDAEFIGRGGGGVRRFEITARFTFDQAHAFEAALSRLGGVRVREIPDAPNVAVDETADNAATVGIDSPPNNDVADGSYVVTEWDSRRLNERFQELEFVVAET
ncbi:hypothetical protein OSG_eHP18_00105 [environmental Halophage eHP-18]|nr:hypothetical protein OSG_eHP17_00015 [environmental Halophage eHP-17]AFH22178.1 hypothetical protein OSG_eHP18_00105 [environmental Halophage eHP-18]AFH22706.1 hypothetical protein OSG_eHP33_00015 [environmental Halophage eHP-33]